MQSKSPLPPTFGSNLLHNLREGISQREDEKDLLLVLTSRIIYYSFCVIQDIQNVVKKESLILRNSNGQPYLENACCQSKEGDRESAIDFFIKKSQSIQQNNEIVQNLTNILDDITSCTKSGLFLSPFNTKNIYGVMNTEFNEKTIYAAFIKFCRLNSLIPTPKDLLVFCQRKPDNFTVSSANTIDFIIQKIKQDGLDYNNEEFVRLLQIISRKNLIKIDFKEKVDSPFAMLKNFIKNFDDESIILKSSKFGKRRRDDDDDDKSEDSHEDEDENDDDLNINKIDKKLCDLINEVIENYKLSSDAYTNEIQNLHDFLIEANSKKKHDLIEFIRKNTNKPNRFKKIIKILTNLLKWNISKKESKINNIPDDNNYRILQFMNEYLLNISALFPNIILEKVNYDNIHIPRYYGFSSIHMSKLKSKISDYYSKFKSFYDVPNLQHILSVVQKVTKNIILLSKYTPKLSSIKVKGKIIKPMFDESTNKYLVEYYLLSIFEKYILLCNNPEMILQEKMHLDIPSDDLSSFSFSDLKTVEGLEDIETGAYPDVDPTAKEYEPIILGDENKSELRKKVANLFLVFVDIFNTEKQFVDVSYDKIQDTIFKLKEREKNNFTDRLKSKSIEERQVDTMLKINQLGIYGIGMQKGLRILDKDMYDRDEEFRHEMEDAEREVYKSNPDATEQNIDMLREDYLERRRRDEFIAHEDNDMLGLGETYYDGAGYDGDEREKSDYDDEL